MSAAPAPELNHLNLKFGDALQLQFAGEDPRFAVRLVGYLENRSIIVTVPVHNRRLVPVRPGQELNIRMMVNDRACAFVTRVIHYYRVPYPHMHLEYPQELLEYFRHLGRVNVFHHMAPVYPAHCVVAYVIRKLDQVKLNLPFFVDHVGKLTVDPSWKTIGTTP